MTVNHLPTELRALTDQSLGIFSAAEGFVFLSGLLAGWVYTRKFRSGGTRGLWEATLGRVKAIYGWHIASFVLCLISVQLALQVLGYCSPTAPRLFYEHPVQALGLGIALLHQPGLLDLLPMYCAFVLMLPFVIGGLESGRRWVVLSVSAAVWLLAQLAPPLDGAPLYPINPGSFNLFAWQFLFVAGVVIGNARMSGLEQVTRPRPWIVAAAAALAVYSFGVHHYQWATVWPDSLFGVLLNKPALGLLRLADFASFAYLVGIFGARFPRAISWRPLAFLGRHSLVVVATQSVAVMILLQFDGLFETGVERTLTTAATVGLLFAAAGAHQALRDRSAEARLPAGLGSRPGAGLVGRHGSHAA